ncbi:MAG: DUF5703 domain-containing protein [Bacteroidota bacterium]
MDRRLIILYGLMTIGLIACQNGNIGVSQNLEKLEAYNVVWDVPSKDYNGSMPIGNGDIGLNVWVEENGDICFYIGKTDSWGDNGRLLKVGKVRVKCEPAIVSPGSQFRQELDLQSGTIRISTNRNIQDKQVDFNLQLWVDANHPVIHLSHESQVPVSMSATIETWRKEPFSLPWIGVGDLLREKNKPGELHEPVIVEPDHILKKSDDYIGWYHHNKKSVGFDLTNQLQGLSDYFKEDPILHRTFGAIITGTKAEVRNDTTLATASARRGGVNIYVLTKHPSQPGEWQKEAENLIARIDSISIKKRREAHKEWWKGFWARSWIHARNSDSSTPAVEQDAFIVSRAYTLQRFIDASAGRGNYPIKFNGSIFTVPASEKPGAADYRRWGPGYWWQNTRIPYLSMLTSGDYDLIQPMLRMYSNEIYQLCQFRTRKYFGFEGAYFPECMYFWGSVYTATYGWTPYEERPDKLQESGWHKWEWVAGPELVFMMLDYYDYTQDKDFLKSKIIPIANDVIEFFDNYYEENDTGKLVMYPSQSAETWWDCTNAMPELAGLHSITRRLSALPERLTNQEDRKYWKKFRNKLPDIPLRETPSGKALAPAANYADKRNVENPELYAVFPFRLYGVGQPGIELAKNALEHRWDKGNFGWRQDGLFMTYLGLSEQAKENLVSRSRNFDKESRFPAFWGPNYDWVPDQDHGGILMKTFQSMLIQSDPYSKKIYLLPAWPKGWDCDFKLHAPYNTIIEGHIRNDSIISLVVTPEHRREDLIIQHKYVN